MEEFNPADYDYFKKPKPFVSNKPLDVATALDFLQHGFETSSLQVSS
jgi:hypothetical protein